MRDDLVGNIVVMIAEVFAEVFAVGCFLTAAELERSVVEAAVVMPDASRKTLVAEIDCSFQQEILVFPR